ncbi:MAG: hypothetical protein ABII71_00055, partial [Candidatus Micrarchaeota archaeon]
MGSTPALHLSLGLTSNSRKRRLRDKILKTAEADAKSGFSTRIPFLKSALCGQDVLSGPSAVPKPNRKYSGKGVGSTMELKANYLYFLRFHSFLKSIARFNLANAENGMQAIQQQFSLTKSSCFLVTPVDIDYIGDLPVARVLDFSSRLVLAGGGMYSPPLFEVFLAPPKEMSFSEEVIMTHELEHAIHFSLWHRAGFPFLLLATEDAEYLAMVKTIREVSNMNELLHCPNPFLHGENLGEGMTSEPHQNAVNRFYLLLQEKYRMSLEEIAMGVSWAIRDKLSNPEDVQPDWELHLNR